MLNSRVTTVWSGRGPKAPGCRSGQRFALARRLDCHPDGWREADRLKDDVRALSAGQPPRLRRHVNLVGAQGRVSAKSLRQRQSPAVNIRRDHARAAGRVEQLDHEQADHSRADHERRVIQAGRAWLKA